MVPRTSRGCPPPTSPGCSPKILFYHPEDVPNWRPRDVPIWRPEDVSKWRPRDVPWRLIRDVLRTLLRDVPGTFSGHPLNDFENTSYGLFRVIYWIFLNLFLFFFWNLFDWPNLSKSSSILKVYLEYGRTSKMKLFCEIS